MEIEVAVDDAGARRPGPRAAVPAGTMLGRTVGTGIVGTRTVVPGRSGSAMAGTGVKPLAPLVPAPLQAWAATANIRITPAL